MLPHQFPCFFLQLILIVHWYTSMSSNFDSDGTLVSVFRHLFSARRAGQLSTVHQPEYTEASMQITTSKWQYPMQNRHVTLCICRWKRLGGDAVHLSACVCVSALCAGPAAQCSEEEARSCVSVTNTSSLFTGILLAIDAILVSQLRHDSTARSRAYNHNGAAGRRLQAGSDQTARCARSSSARRLRLHHCMSMAGCQACDFRRTCLLIRSARRISKHAKHFGRSHPGEQRKCANGCTLRRLTALFGQRFEVWPSTR